MNPLSRKINADSKLGKMALVLGIACLLFMTVYLWQNRADAKARQELDSILAEEPQSEWQSPELFSSLNPPYPLMPDPDRYIQHILDEMNRDFENINFPKINQFQNQSPSIQIRENPDVYIVEVPVNKPTDANQIQVQVDPHFIQVSGKITQQSGNQFFSTSSFMQSFSTDSELDTQHVQRKVQGNTLVVTIPKKKEAFSRKPFPLIRSGNFI